MSAWDVQRRRTMPHTDWNVLIAPAPCSPPVHPVHAPRERTSSARQTRASAYRMFPATSRSGGACGSYAPQTKRVSCSLPHPYRTRVLTFFTRAVLISLSRSGQSSTWLPAMPLYSIGAPLRGPPNTATFVACRSTMSVLNIAHVEAQLPFDTGSGVSRLRCQVHTGELGCSPMATFLRGTMRRCVTGVDVCTTHFRSNGGSSGMAVLNGVHVSCTKTATIRTVAYFEKMWPGTHVEALGCRLVQAIHRLRDCGSLVVVCGWHVRVVQVRPIRRRVVRVGHVHLDVCFDDLLRERRCAVRRLEAAGRPVRSM